MLTGYQKWVLALAFSPDDRLLAVGSRDHSADIWNVASGEKLVALPEHPGGVWGLDFSPDGALLASACDDGSVQIWDIAPRAK